MNYKKTIAWALILISLAIATGLILNELTKETSNDVALRPFSVYVDPVYGCEYLVTARKVTIRYDKSGKPICGVNH